MHPQAIPNFWLAYPNAFISHHSSIYNCWLMLKQQLANRYSEAIAVLVPPATAAGQPLPSLPAGPQHTSTPNTRPPSSLELLCPSSLHTAAADPETSRSTGRSVSDAANHSHQLAAPRVPAGDVPELRALLSNRSLALLKAGQAAAAVEDASCAIALAPCWPKGHWRMAKAFCELKRYVLHFAAIFMCCGIRSLAFVMC